MSDKKKSKQAIKTTDSESSSDNFSDSFFDLNLEETVALESDNLVTAATSDQEDPLDELSKSSMQKNENLEILNTDQTASLEIQDSALSIDLVSEKVTDLEQVSFDDLKPEAAEDVLPLEVAQLTDDEAVSIIESLLFISDRPVGLSTFKNAFDSTNVDTKKIKDLINELKIDFAESRRGVSLEEIDGAFQLRTKSDNQDFIKKILKPKVFKLTGPSLETLSILAYKQPCIKSQVDEIRGVESGHLVRALMDKGLVAFDGKSDFPGRPMLYKTTRKFLEVFGLRNLSELPSLSEIEELLPEGIGEDDNKQTLSQLAGKLEENFEAQSYSIGEDELGKISEQLSGISTETEFFEVEKRKQRESRDRDRAEGIRETLILGEPVDPKDEKWLQRYDIKMNQDLEDGKVVEKESVSIQEVEVLADSSEENKSDLTDLVNEDPLDLL